MKKKLIAILLTGVMAMSLAACGGSNANEQDNCYGEDMPVINE